MGSKRKTFGKRKATFQGNQWSSKTVKASTSTSGLKLGSPSSTTTQSHSQVHDSETIEPTGYRFVDMDMLLKFLWRYMTCPDCNVKGFGGDANITGGLFLFPFIIPSLSL